MLLASELIAVLSFRESIRYNIAVFQSNHTRVATFSSFSIHLCPSLGSINAHQCMDWICRGINWWLTAVHPGQQQVLVIPQATTIHPHSSTTPPPNNLLFVGHPHYSTTTIPWATAVAARRESHHNPISAPRTNPIHTQRICTRKGLQTFKDDENDDGDDDDARLPPTSAQEQSRTHDSVVDDGVDGGARMNE